MKKILCMMSVLVLINKINAQSVGIGTSNPNSKAQLEIASTSKGLLIPSMTTSQRLAITSPPNGLLLYDTDKNEFYHYNSAGWTPIVNGTYWNRPITSRDRISTSDSVGIGTSAPTQRLDVNGNIRSRSNIEAEGTMSTNGFIATGNAVIAGTAVVNGSLTTNGDINMNGAGGTIQFKDAGNNTGFVQISSENLRIGTNSGNSAGKFVIRTDGADRITVDANGTLNYTNKITSDVTGTVNMMPLCWGVTLAVDGVPIIPARGSANASVTRLQKGRYRITCNGITPTSAIFCAPKATRIVIGSNANFGYADIFIRTSDTSEDFDQTFNYLIY